MKYLEFQDVMLAKGYSMRDVYDSVIDFFNCHRSYRCLCSSFNRLIERSIYFSSGDVHSFSKKSKKLILDFDKMCNDQYGCNVRDAFDFLLEKKKIDHYFPVSHNELYEMMLYDLWFDLRLFDNKYDEDWHMILEDC